MNELSERAKKLLDAAGWTPDRNVDTTQAKADLEFLGYHWNEHADKFLQRFGGLVTPNADFGFIDRERGFNYESDGSVAYHESQVGKLLCPIGYFHEDLAGLLVAEDGTTYWIIETSGGYIADSCFQALNIILSAHSKLPKGWM